MSLTVKSLNGDTSFLLIFTPAAPLGSRSFTILVDPWLVGSSIILNSVFSISRQKAQPCISHLKQLETEPDLVIISQHKPDHCHEETLRQLPSDCNSTILATPAAAKKIRSWKYFSPRLVHTLPRYVKGDGQSVYRIALPPPTPQGSCGEVTVTWMPAKRDISGVHHAFGITYRPPWTASRCNNREKTLSVIYSPHGVSYDIICPYATSHLVSEAALPLTALLHSFDCVENPWWLGGKISAGSPGGIEIARNLHARAWISAHDADKDNRGWAVKQTRIGQYAVDEVERMLREGSEGVHVVDTKAICLASGEQRRIGLG